MSAPIDCPICMDCIESFDRNCVTTECGHCFHTNCLMQNVAHNGFDCPYCRTVMAEVPKKDEDEEDEEEEDMFDDNALRGLRFFWNNINGVPHDDDDDSDEEQMEHWETRANENQEDPSIPTTDLIAQKLKEKGVTFEQLIKIICQTDHEEYEQDEQAERLGNELFGSIRIIVSNYNPKQAV